MYLKRRMGGAAPSRGAWSSTRTGLLSQQLSSGVPGVIATAETPARASILWRIASSMRVVRSGSGTCSAGIKMRIVSISGAPAKPGTTRRSASSRYGPRAALPHPDVLEHSALFAVDEIQGSGDVEILDVD